MSALTHVTLQLGRNPEQGFPDGDRHEGYIINAPLGADGMLNAELWAKYKKDCKVVRYSANDDKDADGLLVHRNGKWLFEYDEAEEGPDEDLFHLSEHRLWVGDYVTIHDNESVPLVYVVVETN